MRKVIGILSRGTIYLAGGLAVLLLVAILVLLAVRGHPAGLVLVGVGAAVPYLVRLVFTALARRNWWGRS
jgi:hypothetical protein